MTLIEINNLLSKIYSFEEIVSTIQDKTIINNTKRILKSYSISPKYATHILSSWLIYKFPNDTNTTELYTITQTFHCHIRDNTITKDILLSYIDNFMKWKKNDFNKTSEKMIENYHQLGVELLNTNDENIQKNIRKTREEILISAKQMGGDTLINTILSYQPVVIETEKFLKIYNKLFWEQLSIEYNNGEYTHIYCILEEILKKFIQLSPNKQEQFNEIIDIPFIKSQINHGVYTNDDIITLSLNILNITEELHSSSQDNNTQYIRDCINNSEIDLPVFLEKIMEELNIIFQQIEYLLKEQSANNCNVNKK
jgi:hypothetical protein